jgi:hypothetical protein
MRFRWLLGLMLALWAIPSSAEISIDLASAPNLFRIENDDSSDDLSERVAVCDLNADGLLDLVVSAPEADGESNARPLAGEVYIVTARRGRWAGSHPAATVRSTAIIGREIFDGLGSGANCADFNGDGTNDLLLGAIEGDGVGDLRSQSGQSHLLIGSASWPATIDLASTPGTVIYGARADDGTGSWTTFGDINGDGLVDIIDSAFKSSSFSGTQPNAGRAHVIFGRASWPSSIDLLTQSDVTIWGVRRDDFLSKVSAWDLNGDGTDELFASAAAADGVNDARPESGDTHVFWGRSVWPGTIDLATTSANMLLVGADTDDWSGDGAARYADYDADGRLDVVLGHRRADGPGNTRANAGEVRIWEPNGVFPPVVDFRTTFESVIYGIDSNDRCFNDAQKGDFNRDGYQDLATTCGLSNGPGNSRNGAGEVIVVYGGPSFPTVRDLQVQPPDIIVYGPGVNDGIDLVAVSDVNDDGVDELAIGTSSVGPNDYLWLISPFDFDGDGWQQLVDNCPLVPNADQLDTNQDLRGDACQLDWDGDAVLDGVDCSLRDPDAGRPGSVSGVVLMHDRVSGTTSLTWQQSPTADRYDVSRGLISELGVTSYGSCQTGRDPNPGDTQFDEDQLPPVGEAFFFVVRGVDLSCGGAGSWGSASNGSERVNGSPAGCS